MLLKIKETYAEESNPIAKLPRTTGKSQPETPVLMKLLQFIIIGCIVSAFTFNACTINSTQANMPEQDLESDQGMTSLTFDKYGSHGLRSTWGRRSRSFDLRTSGRLTREGKDAFNGRKHLVFARTFKKETYTNKNQIRSVCIRSGSATPLYVTPDPSGRDAFNGRKHLIYI